MVKPEMSYLPPLMRQCELRQRELEVVMIHAPPPIGCEVRSYESSRLRATGPSKPLTRKHATYAPLYAQRAHAMQLKARAKQR